MYGNTEAQTKKSVELNTNDNIWDTRTIAKKNDSKKSKLTRVYGIDSFSLITHTHTLWITYTHSLIHEIGWDDLSRYNMYWIILLYLYIYLMERRVRFFLLLFHFEYVKHQSMFTMLISYEKLTYSPFSPSAVAKSFAFLFISTTEIYR